VILEWLGKAGTVVAVVALLGLGLWQCVADAVGQSKAW
jgi:hypothetical protein